MRPRRPPTLARRKFTAADELPLVGGRPCLDLVNTTGARATGTPRERLNTYEDLLVWSRRADVLTASDARALAQRSVGRLRQAQRALARVRMVREGLYRLFRAVIEGRPLPGREIARLNRLDQAERRRRKLIPGGRGLTFSVEAATYELDQMLWPLVASAVELLTSEELTRVRRCAECDWLFLDTSKNGSRRWCKNLCGDRVRARRHYLRRRLDGDPP